MEPLDVTGEVVNTRGVLFFYIFPENGILSFAVKQHAVQIKKHAAFLYDFAHECYIVMN